MKCTFLSFENQATNRVALIVSIIDQFGLDVVPGAKIVSANGVGKNNKLPIECNGNSGLELLKNK